jgi:hypothetical protein
MPKTKKKIAKKRGRKPGATTPKLPKDYTVLELANPFGKTFEIEINPPPVGRRDPGASIKFRERVSEVLPKLKPGQAFVFYDGHSLSWVRKQLIREYPEHQFIVTQVKDSETGIRVYLKR